MTLGPILAPGTAVDPTKVGKTVCPKHCSRPPDKDRELLTVSVKKRRQKQLSGEGDLNSPFYPHFPLLNIFTDCLESLSNLY